jgi:hypothetical protein
MHVKAVDWLWMLTVGRASQTKRGPASSRNVKNREVPHTFVAQITIS